MATQMVLVIVQATIVLSQVCSMPKSKRSSVRCAQTVPCLSREPFTPSTAHVSRLQWHKAESLEAKLLPGCFLVVECGMMAFMRAKSELYLKHRHVGGWC